MRQNTNANLTKVFLGNKMKNISYKVFNQLLLMGISITPQAFAEQTSEEAEELERISVIASKNNRLSISTKKLLTLPGTANDPLKALEALPGVVLAAPSSGGPIAAPAIRGSSSSDNLYMTDGIPVGYVFHNDGLSTYNPLLIDSFSLSSGAWGSQYDNATGGVILTQLREPSLTTPSANLELSLVRSGFLIESPLGEDMAGYLSFRESLVHTYVDNFIEDEDFSFKTPPRNRDYQSKFLWEYDDNNTLVFSATGAKDYIEIAFDADSRDVDKNPDLASGETRQEYYHSQALTWTNTNWDSVDFNITLSHLQKNQQEAEGEVFKWDADIDEWRISVNANTVVSGADLNIGGYFQIADIDFASSGRLLPCNIDFEMCPPSYFSSTYDEVGSLNVDTYLLHANVNKHLTESISLVAGISLVGNQFSDETYLEPRLQLNMPINDNHQIRLSYGKHHQWVDNYRFLMDTWGNPDLQAMEADHIVLGWDYRYSNDVQIRTELYYKTMKNMIVANPAAQITGPNQAINDDVTTFLNNGEGSSFGAELLISKTFSDDWFGWFSLAWSDTERENTLTSEKFNYQFDCQLSLT